MGSSRGRTSICQRCSSTKLQDAFPVLSPEKLSPVRRACSWTSCVPPAHGRGLHLTGVCVCVVIFPSLRGRSHLGVVLAAVGALAKSVLERADLLKHSGGQRGWHAGKLWVLWVIWGRGPTASRPRRAVERGRSTGRSTMCRVRGSGVSKSRGWMCVYVGPVEGNGAASSFIPGGGLTWGWDGLEAWG